MLKGKVAVVYHFFAHYRAGVIQEMKNRLPVVFMGGEKDCFSEQKDNIKAFEFGSDYQFVHLENVIIKKSFLFQRGLSKYVFSGDIKHFIFLGDVRFLSTWFYGIVARLMGKKVYFWTTGWHKPESGLHLRLRKLFYSIPNKLLLYSEFAKKYGAEVGLSPSKMIVIYNSLNYEQQKAIRSAVTREKIQEIKHSLFPRNPAAPLIICTTRLSEKRRLDLLLKAVKMIQEQHGMQINVLLVGTGNHESVLRAMTVELGIQDQVHFYGACYEEEVLGGLIMAADVTVAPGMVGLTAMHSLAYGTPVITHDNLYNQAPEYEAIVPGYNGMLFKENDVQDLADKIYGWIKEHPDRQEVFEHCVKVIEDKYNPRFQTDQILRALQEEGA